MSARPDPSPPTPLAQALRRVRPDLWRAAAFGWVAGVLALAPAWYMQMVYDRVVTSRGLGTLVWLSLAVLAAAVLMAGQQWVRAALLRATADRLDEALAPSLAASGWQRRLHGGEPGSLLRVAEDLRQLREALVSPALLALMDLPLVGLLWGLLCLISPWLGLAMVVAAALQAAISLGLQRVGAPVLREIGRLAWGLQQRRAEALAATGAVQAMGMAAAGQQRLDALEQPLETMQTALALRQGHWNAWSRGVSQVSSSLLLGLGAWLLWHDALNGGAAMLAVSGMLGARLLAPLAQLAAHGAAVEPLREAWARLQRLQADEPAPPPALALPAPRGPLVVEQLAVAAPGQSVPWLHGLQFRLEPGQALAVIGPSGAGKSTLAQALLGVWRPLGGSVRLDGAELSRWPKEQVGRHLGCLPQDPVLLDGSLAENIARFGLPDPALLAQALADADLDAWVATLPQGLQTPLGEGGWVLSGGQRQRVALARALYGRPHLVVLDEPNAHLDEAGEAALRRWLARRRELEVCCVVMTHRAGVLAEVDRVLLLAQGQQQAEGPRDEVMARLRGGAPAGRPA